MQEVRFFATVGEDQLIRPPSGTLIPGDKVEVVIRPIVANPPKPEIDDSSMSGFDRMAETRAFLLRFAAEAEAIADPPTLGPGTSLEGIDSRSLDPSAHEETSTEEDPFASLREMLLGFAAEAERIAPPLPSDMAMNHDHYAHGKPLP